VSGNDLCLIGVGDIRPDWPTPDSIVEMELTMPIFRDADILFGNLEAPMSDKGERQVCNSGRKISPEKVKLLTDAGFDVMSFANNHHLDYGDAAFHATLDILAANKIAQVGAGANIVEARKPVVLDRNGTKVAFLAYSSVLPIGYEARENRPGCAPLRVSTFYEQVDRDPGSPPRIVSITKPDDLAAMVKDVKRARQQADVVVLSMHWGVHYVPGLIAMYQREIAHAAIDAGADLILGHHPHIVKGIETYKGKVIFYSLGNFVMPAKAGHVNPTRILYGVKVAEEFKYYPYPGDCRKTLIAKCVITDKRIKRVSYFPGLVNTKTQPEPLAANDKRSTEVYDYVTWCCRDQKLDTEFSQDGDEIVVNA
jgi:poly-gamma-glutamate synthesis protein (capsule biosynthesis protein)